MAMDRPRVLRQLLRHVDILRHRFLDHLLLARRFGSKSVHAQLHAVMFQMLLSLQIHSKPRVLTPHKTFA